MKGLVLFLDDGICSFQEVKNFYESFVGVPKDKLEKVAQEGYRAMTAVNTRAFLDTFLVLISAQISELLVITFRNLH